MASSRSQPPAELARIEAGFEALSDELAVRFRRSTAVASRLLSRAEVLTWATDCLALAESAPPRSVDAATECFQATPKVAAILDAARFLRWVQRGRALCLDGPDLSVAYFGASPRILAMLPEAMSDVWLELGPGLYQKDPESIALASRFILAMPDLLPVLSLVEMERLSLLLNRLRQSSHDLAGRCLTSAHRAFDGLQDGLPAALLSVALNLVRLNAVLAADFFEQGAVALSGLDGHRQKEFLALIETVARDNARNALLLMAAGRAAFGSIEVGLHSRVIDRTRVLATSPPAAIAFLENCPAVVSELGAAGLERWATEGVRIFRLGQDAGLAYFRIGTGDLASLERLSTRASLDDVGGVLLLYAQALAGDGVELRPAEDVPPWSFGLIRPGTTTTGGTALGQVSFPCLADVLGVDVDGNGIVFGAAEGEDGLVR